ncbi:hypothetical protein PFISCL1PPCAC_25500, partial [Pristionchus fissidentatus]
QQPQQLQPSIVLSTRSTRLLIHLLSPDCSLSLSEDKKSLFCSSSTDKPLSKIELSLKGTDGELMTSPLFSSFHQGGRQGSIRIDSFFPLIFGDEDDIELLSNKILSWVGYLWPCPAYRMEVLAEFGGDLQAPRLDPIYSASSMVDGDTVVASREFLSLRSPFFLTLFYGDFVEKNKNVYEIKEVSVDDFRFFMTQHANMPTTGISHRSTEPSPLSRSPIDSMWCTSIIECYRTSRPLIFPLICYRIRSFWLEDSPRIRNCS